jgi:hypothetical protein
VGREREWGLQMKGWVRECGFSRELSHFMLTHGSHPLKWQTTHFPLTAAVLYLTGWSGGTGELPGNLLSLLIWFNLEWFGIEAKLSCPWVLG